MFNSAPGIGIIYYIIGVGAATLIIRRFIHLLQLESYQAFMYVKRLKTNLVSDYLPLAVLCFIGAAVSLVVFILLDYNLIKELRIIYHNTYGILALCVCIAAASLIFNSVIAKRKIKKPLVFTKRIIRLMCAYIVVCLAVFVLIGTVNSEIAVIILSFAAIAMAPFVLLLAHFIDKPIEESIKQRFFNEAKNKLRESKAVKIGITGSFGKTSAKFILNTILSQSLYSLTTPSSFNTPMGITRVVRERLTDHDEVFIAEMGARYKGDIKELANLVRPKYGLITSVGLQHLETFRSIENIIDTKYELIQALPPDGEAFFNADNPYCLEMYERCGVKKFLFGIDCPGRLFVRAKNITVGPQGSTFDLICPDGIAACKTILLGKHNILNILGCCAVALRLGMDLQIIADGISRIQPIEHRLQIINTPKLTVIDDAFNSNPEGARAALEILAQFEGRRFIVTPGMIELGEEEKEQNVLFGRRIAQTCDHAILVGKSFADYIIEGLYEEDFDPDKISRAEDLSVASSILARLSQPGDVVLFENDLPDNFN